MAAEAEAQRPRRNTGYASAVPVPVDPRGDGRAYGGDARQDPRNDPRMMPDLDLPAAAVPGGVDRRVRREATITFSELAVPPILAREPSQIVFTTGDTALPTLDDEQVAAEVGRLLAETDTFVKYGLIERAADHVRKVFDLAPEHEEAQERLIAILVQLRRTAEAVEELGILADRRSVSDPAAAIRHLQRALELDPTAIGARHMLGRLTGEGAEGDEVDVLELDELEDADLQPVEEGVSEGDGDARAAATVDSEDAEWEAIGPTGAGPNVRSDEGQTALEDDFSGGGSTMVSAGPGIGGPEFTPHVSNATVVAAPAPLLDELEIDFEAGGSVAAAPEHITSVEMDEDLPVAKGGIAIGSEDFTPPPVATLDAATLGELEQVDFLLDQGLSDDAAAVLDDLGPRLHQHPAVVSRRRRIAEILGTDNEFGRSDDSATVARAATSPRQPDAGAVPRGAVGSDSGRTPVRDVVTPRAVMAAGTSVDPATQRDLGIAYKEMGLSGAAITEFAKLADDPEHQVFALMMMGECYEEGGAFAEALAHYKKALNRPSVRGDEATRLYFLLGRAFEALGDKGEALYFFEKVAKRDPRFGDVAARVHRLRQSGVAPVDHAGADDRRVGAVGGRSGKP